MTNIPNKLLCYTHDVDDLLRKHYVDVSWLEFTYTNAEDVLNKSIDMDWQQKLLAIKSIFPVMAKPDVGSIYDIRYTGRPNTRALYDLLFMPSFSRPAHLLTLSVDGDHVRKLDWSIFFAREFSKVDPGLYLDRFRILKEDLAAVRLSGIELLNDRLPAGGFERWLEATQFR